jgi:hypothetical protein
VLLPERRGDLEREFASVPAFRPSAEDLPPNVAHLNRCETANRVAVPAAYPLWPSVSFPTLRFPLLL